MNRLAFPKAYACYNNNLDVRMKSTSGGIFSIIAENILEKNGVVYGAGFDADFHVIHMKVESADQLDALRGSKYPQSKIGDTFKDAKCELEQGRLVLFVGTPCQIVALHNFLRKNYENLWTIDFVCHGVASPELWIEYLNAFEDRKKIKSIVFKSKIVSWKRWRFKVEYDNKIKYVRGYMNPYMRSYLAYANIRPSCYTCKFKGLSRLSDFTISDCWGIGEQNQALNDDRGLSALLVHSQKACDLFNAIAAEITYQEYDPVALMEGNFTTFRSVEKNPVRDEFYKDVHAIGVKKAFDKYYVPRLRGWLKYYLLCMIGKEK